MKTLIQGLYIRPLQTGDTALLRNLYGGLSSDSIYQRFFQSKLSETHLDTITNLERSDGTVSVGAFIGQNGDTRLIAVAQFTPLRDELSAAEISIVVADEYQCNGVARKVMSDLIAIAMARGFDVFYSERYVDNHRVRKLLRKTGLAALAQRPEDTNAGVTLERWVQETAA